MTIGRDNRDSREIYHVARELHGLRDLSGYVMQKVKLTMHVVKRPERPAHRVCVEITAPNGLNDRRQTESDRKLVLAQLARLGVCREF